MSRRHNILATLTALLGLAVSGCGLDSVPGNQSEQPEPEEEEGEEHDGEWESERQMYEMTVLPTLEAKCGTTACHEGSVGQIPTKFLGNASLSSYEAMIQYPEVHGLFQPNIAGVLIQITEEDHYAVTYTPEEEASILDWLQAEALVRDVGDQGPLATGAFPTFSGCMTLENWEASQMYRWADLETENDGPCNVCHNDGLARFNTNDNRETMFMMNRYELYLIGFFTTAVDLSGTEMVVPAYDKLMRFGDDAFHPRYNYNTHLGYLTDFYERTMLLMEEDGCPEYSYPQY